MLWTREQSDRNILGRAHECRLCAAGGFPEIEHRPGCPLADATVRLVSILPGNVTAYVKARICLWRVMLKDAPEEKVSPLEARIHELELLLEEIS